MILPFPLLELQFVKEFPAEQGDPLGHFPADHRLGMVRDGCILLDLGENNLNFFEGMGGLNEILLRGIKKDHLTVGLIQGTNS